jgi:hypothetical protein
VELFASLAKRHLWIPCGLVAFLLPAVAVAEEEDLLGWPRRIEAPQATVTIYQPQLESLTENDLTARGAISVLLNGEEEPRFGAVWFGSAIDVDRDVRMVYIRDVKVTDVRFPEASQEHLDQLTELLETEMPKWDLSFSLDHLLAMLDLVDQERVAAEGLKTDPPKIVFINEPAVLVFIDGEPQLHEIEGSDLKQVINSPYPILFDQASDRYYLDGGETWYRAHEPLGPWTVVASVPPAVAALRPPPPDEPDLPEGVEVAEEEEDDRIPRIVIATEPTELIVIDGDTKWTPLPDSGLLYVSNTDSDVLMEVATQRYFVVLSGRWFASKSLDGPWMHVPSDELPVDFGEIPDESDMGHVRVFVAGTEEAHEAVLENQIPQTSAIKRSEAKLEVEYDGDPIFEPIEDTELKFAVNTATPVIQDGEWYYACDQAVWFTAGSANGPWIVADKIPDEIQAIPPSSPVYNTKYVYVYESTPEVVYVGYTPAYTGSYVHHTTIVYGTGWHYNPWWGPWFYPRPATWGFHVRWNPWTGWGVGFSFSTGRFRVSVGFGGPRRVGWWGPVGFRPIPRGFHHGYRRGARAGYRAGYAAGAQSARGQNNIYNKPGNATRNTRPAQGTATRPATRDTRPNNVYADQSGNVYRRNDNGSWDRRQGDTWTPSDSSATGPSGGAGSGDRSRPSTGSQPSTGSRPSTGSQPSTGSRPSTGTRPSTGSAPSTGSRPSYGSSSNLNRDYNARQRGSQRTNSYRSSGASRGGSRGGGGRRR